MVVDRPGIRATERAIREFIAERFLFTDDVSQVKDDESLIASGAIDSTGILELQLFVEETFGIAVEDEEVVPDNFDSVVQLAEYVERKQREARADGKVPRPAAPGGAGSPEPARR